MFVCSHKAWCAGDSCVKSSDMTKYRLSDVLNSRHRTTRMFPKWQVQRLNQVGRTWLGHHFQGQKVKGQLAGGGVILWRPAVAGLDWITPFCACCTYAANNHKTVGHLRHPVICDKRIIEWNGSWSVQVHTRLLHSCCWRVAACNSRVARPHEGALYFRIYWRIFYCDRNLSICTQTHTHA